MSYKLLVPVLLLAFATSVCALNTSVHKLNKKSLEQSADFSPVESIRHNASNVVDPYQYCFTNSSWVVPPQTLLAYLYDNGTVTPAIDQTVWVINTYDRGYFAGQSYTAINNAILSQKYLIGSVTSEGQVFMTFYSGTSTSTDLITGLGNLKVKSSGQCLFTMQMNSGQNGVSGLTHWSYMIPVHPGDVFYNNLPGTNMSVPQFIAQF